MNTSLLRNAALLSVLLPAAVAAATIAGVEIPSPLPPKNVVDTHWGTTVDDPYRFLEDTANPEIQKYMRAQADAAQAVLDKLPARDRLLARIREIDADTPPALNALHRDKRGRLFYLKREPTDNQFKLYRRDTPTSAEVLLVDPEVLMKSTGKPHAIGAFAPSPDGALVAYSISASGSEIGTLHVIDTTTLKEVIPAVDRIRFGEASWLEDGSGFFYSRLRPDYETVPRAERFLDNLTYLRLLKAPEKDASVFGPGLHPEVSIERSAGGAVFVVPGMPYAIAAVYHGVDPNRSVYIADLQATLKGTPKWRKVVGKEDLVNDFAIAAGQIYLKTAKDAPRYKIVRTAFPATDLSRTETVFAPSDAVIGDLATAKEGVYITRREGVAKQLYRLGLGAGAQPEKLTMPVEGTISLSDVDPRLEGAVIRLGGWTRAPAYYALGPSEKTPKLLALVPPGKFDAPAGITARNVMVKSHDGVEVPVSILSRTDLKLDGSNPTMVYGYGAYGSVEEPTWTTRTLAWLERGGVLAIAHVRGGGIYGDGWRRAGWKTTKPNTWKDGIAAAEWLIANGYTSRGKISIYGGSAGGIFVGRAITERPDLFSAAVIAVGNTDSVRSETRANGAGNIPEYGTVKLEDEFKALLAMSPYANIRNGTAYPAVLLEHGVNDSRVDVWMTLKTGTRLAAASTSGKPVLMRLEYDGGHGIGATREQLQKRVADRWAFFLWQAGIPEFQPK